MVKAELIILSLVKELRGRNREYVIPNLYLGNWECDVYSETAKYSEEYEVKISRADYWNDFSKSYKFYSGGTINKHELIKEGKRVNRFWFVTPMELTKMENLILLTDIPSYAGLIYFFPEDYAKFKIIKQAPLLSRENLLHPKAVVNASYHRYCHYSSKYYRGGINELKKSVELI